MALIEKLNAIGDAIREKTGGTEKLTLDQMPTEIASITTGGEMEIPSEALIITGDCRYAFANEWWEWYIETFGDKITTHSIYDATSMFENCKLTSIPFDINLSSAAFTLNMFSNSYLRSIPKITGKINTSKWKNYLTSMFDSCHSLKTIAECDLSFENDNYRDYCKAYYLFRDCYSLRAIPASYGNIMIWALYDTFHNCYVLDQIVDIPLTKGPFSYMSGKRFSENTFKGCNRLSRLTFAPETYYSNVDYSGEVMDLSNYVGYASTLSNIIGTGAGFTTDTQVTNNTTYQALKNNPDWWTLDVAYSRYNKTSAVETINSLPDASDYFAADPDRVINTIKFKGAAGSATDGGAINTMTEEQIAVATAKGWTVSFV